MTLSPDFARFDNAHRFLLRPGDVGVVEDVFARGFSVLSDGHGCIYPRGALRKVNSRVSIGPASEQLASLQGELAAIKAEREQVNSLTSSAALFVPLWFSLISR